MKMNFLKTRDFSSSIFARSKIVLSALICCECVKFFFNMKTLSYLSANSDFNQETKCQVVADFKRGNFPKNMAPKTVESKD